MVVVYIIVAAWIACGVVAYGITLGYFRHEYPQPDEKGHEGIASLMALVGPIGLIVSVVNSDIAKHGMKFK